MAVRAEATARRGAGSGSGVESSMLPRGGGGGCRGGWWQVAAAALAAARMKSSLAYETLALWLHAAGAAVAGARTPGPV
tara:strand:- start:1693 stop:1929 length:237 start_codon:yes stop_codon:yes gene_type:complete